MTLMMAAACACFLAVRVIIAQRPRARRLARRDQWAAEARENMMRAGIFTSHTIQ
jgi:hypothetical protein